MQNMQNMQNIAICRILRDTTVIVKVSPFIYAILYVVSAGIYTCYDGTMAYIFNKLFYISPIMVVFNIALSYSLHLCVWHRIECVLPLLTLIPIVLDGCLHIMTFNVAYIHVITIMIIFALSLICAYVMFVRPHGTVGVRLHGTRTHEHSTT
jgi:hypothetical protein